MGNYTRQIDDNTKVTVPSGYSWSTDYNPETVYTVVDYDSADDSYYLTNEGTSWYGWAYYKDIQIYDPSVKALEYKVGDLVEWWGNKYVVKGVEDKYKYLWIVRADGSALPSTVEAYRVTRHVTKWEVGAEYKSPGADLSYTDNVGPYPFRVKSVDEDGDAVVQYPNKDKSVKNKASRAFYEQI